MRCNAIGSTYARKIPNYSLNFKGRNNLDYSKSRYTRDILNDGSVEYYDIQNNKYDQLISYVKKIIKDGEMINREFYDCEYYDNGRMKTEKYINQDFIQKNETITTIEYYPNFKVKNYEKYKRPLF